MGLSSISNETKKRMFIFLECTQRKKERKKERKNGQRAKKQNGKKIMETEERILDKKERNRYRGKKEEK